MNNDRELLEKNKRKIGVKNDVDTYIQENRSRKRVRKDKSTGVKHVN